MEIERLPFAVRPARPDELVEVAALRARGYGRHAPELGEALTRPEPEDEQPGTTVLVVRAHQDGALLGTLRLHPNDRRPLPVQASVTLPDHLAADRLVEVTRLTVVPGRSDVKLALFKACYRYGVTEGMDHLVAAGRNGVWQQYRALLFDEVFPGTPDVRLAHAGWLPHRVLHLPLADAQRRWSAAGHPWLGYMVGTRHPDVMVGEGYVREPSVGEGYRTALCAASAPGTAPERQA